MLHGRRVYQRGFWPVSESPAPFSTLTYPVLARAALTLTHTATKTAGRPVGAEETMCEGLKVLSKPFSSAHPTSPITLIPDDWPCCSLHLPQPGPRAAWWHSHAQPNAACSPSGLCSGLQPAGPSSTSALLLVLRLLPT